MLLHEHGTVCYFVISSMSMIFAMSIKKLKQINITKGFIVVHEKFN